jgi:hypothetical protein
MKQIVKKLNISQYLVFMISVIMLFGLIQFAPNYRVFAEDEIFTEAYLVYSNGEDEIWSAKPTGNITSTSAIVTGAGTYTVGLDFSTPVSGAEVLALEIKNGRTLFPGYKVKIWDLKINGSVVPIGNGYTCDDGVNTRYTFINSHWQLNPDNSLPGRRPRAYDNNLTNVDFLEVVDPYDLIDVTDIELTFSYLDPYAYVDVANLVIINNDWSSYDIISPFVKVAGLERQIAYLTGPGTYHLWVEFDTVQAGEMPLILIAVNNGKNTFGAASLTITSMKLDGVEITNGTLTSYTGVNEAWGTEAPGMRRYYISSTWNMSGAPNIDYDTFFKSSGEGGRNLKNPVKKFDFLLFILS